MGMIQKVMFFKCGGLHYNDIVERQGAASQQAPKGLANGAI